MNQPLISVALCNFNHARFLRQCFTGLVNQTHRNLEILITDDGSTDGSQEIIRELARNDPRIKPEFFPENRGLKNAYPSTLARCTGQYIYSGACDDFVINKDFFKRAVTVLETDPRPAGYYGITGIYVAETEKLSGAMGTAEVEGYNTPLQCCVGLLKYRSIVTSPSCIWRRDLFAKHGGDQFAELMGLMGAQVDYYLNHDLAWRYGIHYEKTPFACQRVFEAKTNLSANLNIFVLAANLREMELRLRKVEKSYPEIEADWVRWRAINLLDTIKKSGVPL